MGCSAGVVIFNKGSAHLLAIFLTAKVQLVLEITMKKQYFSKKSFTIVVVSVGKAHYLSQKSALLCRKMKNSWNCGKFQLFLRHEPAISRKIAPQDARRLHRPEAFSRRAGRLTPDD
jgi:hypothetical protein